MMSILYPSSKCKSASDIRNKLPKAYMLEDAFLKICPDIKKRAYFLEVLAENPDAITAQYRAETIRDFIREKSLAGQLKEHFRELTSILSDFEDKRKRVFMLDDKKGSDSSIYVGASRLNIAALTLGQLLSVLHNVSGFLQPFELHSESLCLLKKRTEPFLESEAYRDMLFLCTQYSDFSYEKEDFDLLARLDDDSRIAESLFVRQSEKYDPNRLEKGEKFRPKSRNSRLALFSVHVPERRAESVRNFSDMIGKYDSNLFIRQSIDTLTELFVSVIHEIKAEFYALCTELDFYHVAVCYCDYLSDLGIHALFPDISDDGGTHFSKLYDLFLLTKVGAKATVVPNDFLLDAETNGLLIKGDNGSGKTVYIRSIAVAHLLAGAGLPIAAKSANFTLRKVYSVFASSEKKLNESSPDAGRFEEEVKSVAALLECMDNRSLLILNEIFQTTSYNEGAEGLYHILNYLSHKGIKWIAVTHMTDLFDLFHSENVRKSEVDKKTHIIRDFA